MKAIATKIFEYLIMGLPVVSSKGHLSDKLIEEGKCGVSVDSSNVYDIAKGIINIIEQKPIEEMANETINFSRDKYIWERREGKINELINNLV